MLNKIFSITKSNDNKYKIFTILGIKFKFFNKSFYSKDFLEKNNIVEEIIQKVSSSIGTIGKQNNLMLADINRIMQVNMSTMMLHQKTFLQYKCANKGNDIVILASGPSALSYQPIKNAIHIGVNRSFQLNKINLDYIFLQDFSGKTSEYIDELNDYNRASCTKFYGLTTEWEYEPNRTVPETHAINANALRYRTDWADIPYFKSQFAYDISTQPLGCFGSVVFPALQFALWTNPRRIYLVGCDCSLSGYAYNSDDKNFLDTEKIITAYKKFKEFAYKYYPDVEIISINPVGLKGLFKDEYQGVVDGE